MAQQQSTYNLVIQDPNGGQPQYIKLQKPVNIGSATKLIKADNKTVRTIMAQKPASVAQVVNSSGTLIQGGFPQTVRAITIGKPTRHFVTIPVQSTLHNIVSGERSVPQVTTPTITPQPTQIRPAPQQFHTVPHHKPFTASILDTSARKRSQEAESEAQEMNRSMMMACKRRKSEKGGKGLRHFSMKVCEKVRKKGLTSYNEVAEELVNEFTDPKHMPNSVDQQYDQKNIRRRVYDALNVLMAMNIISKEKKEIKWLGLPSTTAQESVSLLNEKKEIAQRIKKKTEMLNELLLQQISFKSLVQRNYETEKNRGPPTPTTSVHLPFIVVNSDKKTVIDCSISSDKTEYLFIFNDKFEIHDDFQVLRQLGLTFGIDTGTVSDADLEKAKSLVSKPFEKYVTKMATANRLANYTSSRAGVRDDDTRGSGTGDRPSASSPGPSQTDGDSIVDVSTDDESNMTEDDEEDNN